MLSAYQNLVGISAIQLMIASALYWRAGARLRAAPRVAGIFAISIPYGCLFDLGIGGHWGIFSYPGEQGRISFLILNSLFSYGAAFCTAWLLPCRLPLHNRRTLRLVGGIASIVALGFLVLMEPAQFTPFERIISAGLGVLVLAEACALASGRLGPLWSAINGGFASCLCLAVGSAALGAAYEGANMVFPLWEWGLPAFLPAWFAELTIVLFGYFVLFHPMLIISRIMFGDTPDAN